MKPVGFRREIQKLRKTQGSEIQKLRKTQGRTRMLPKMLQKQLKITRNPKSTKKNTIFLLVPSHSESYALCAPLPRGALLEPMAPNRAYHEGAERPSALLFVWLILARLVGFAQGVSVSPFCSRCQSRFAAAALASRTPVILRDVSLTQRIASQSVILGPSGGTRRLSWPL